ncbi:EpsG family protein [Leuconostoc lactis]|uniref:EpsG family protein n=1 Tax=Leuconostoc lactis TaxID=1246 RepID=UPI000E969998|nr:EpsG family protein [Leuconostoc lactis]HBP97470.1 hypothetical protein [Leuconostoc lactis]
MLYIISISLAFIGGTLKGKQTQILGIFVFAILAFLSANVDPVTTTDYTNYQTGYLSAPLGASSAFEHGYTLLGIEAYHLGMSYAEFRLIFTYFAYAILVVAILRFTSNISLVAFLFGIMLFFNLTTQIRNLMMIALVLFGLSFLKKKSKINILLFVIFIIIAAQIHTSGYFFLSILPLSIVPPRLLDRLYFVMLFITMLISFLIIVVGNNNFIQLITNLLGFVNRDNLMQRLNNSYSRGTDFLIKFLITLTGIGTSWIAMNIVNRFHVTSDDYQVKNELNLLGAATLVAMLSIPLIFLAPDYSRIPRESMIFLILIVAIYFENRNKFHDMVKMISMYFVFLVPMFIYTHLIIWGPLFIDSIPYIAHWKKF